MFDAATRGQKARKAVAILQDHRPELGGLDLLEIGCSAGYGTVVYAEAFRSVTGIDIDEPAVRHATAQQRAAEHPLPRDGLAAHRAFPTPASTPSSAPTSTSTSPTRAG